MAEAARLQEMRQAISVSRAREGCYVTRRVTRARLAGTFSETVLELLLAQRVHGRGAVAVAFARIAAGAVFVVFGIGKVTHHATQGDSFRTYGLPAPDAFVYAIGVLQIPGGLMLIAGLGTRLAALALAGDM